ncbi:histidine kinase [Streptomyces sp. NPDC089919]|uniref:sensor histidine kinase n=1 Tax=Streptomyces sp. NPDC089919 TaxID=3155188 RepID=UPI003444BB5C
MPIRPQPCRSTTGRLRAAFAGRWRAAPCLRGVLVTALGTTAALIGVLVSHPDGLAPSLPSALLVAVLCSLPLLGHRRMPELSLTGSVLATLSTDNAMPMVFGAWAVTRYGGGRRWWWLCGGAAGYVVTNPLVEADPWNMALLQHVAACVIAPGLLGDRLRRQAALIEDVRDQFRRARATIDRAVAYAVVEERTKLAFDMHDGVGHHMAVVTLQAAAIRARADRPEDVRRAAAAVEESGRAAMRELRDVLDVLRRDIDVDDPVPPTHLAGRGYDGFLRTLVRTMRSMGLDVEHSVTGTGGLLPASVQSALYRVGREAITNAIKHAPGAPVRLRLEHRPAHVDLIVENGPPRGERPRWESCGIGLVGLRTRVEAAGGRLTAGPTGQGGFVLHARLPLPAGAGSPAAAEPVTRE